MPRFLTTLILVIFFFGSIAPRRASAYTLQYTNDSATVRIKWPSATIKIALSSSLNSPPQNIKAGSDVVGAARRALARWSEAANLQFIETSASSLSISPSGRGDGISLITVADTVENRAVFDADERTGRTRVFYDTASGSITEADVVINPAAKFSTDGTEGTFDLEATFTHEIGHVLGLEHSGEVGAAMHPQQGTNGLYEQAAVSPRTLSDDDRAGARALYGSHEGFGSITGRIGSAEGEATGGAHVWAEDPATGKVVAGNMTLADGSYKIEGLPPGQYRLIAEYNERIGERDATFAKGTGAELNDSQAAFGATESEAQISVAAGEIIRQDISLESEGARLKPMVFGSNGHLSTVAVPLVQGKRQTIFVGGEGVDGLSGQGISVTSPFIKVNPASLTLHSGINYDYPIISFDVEVSEDAPTGDYSIRLESKAGEIAYISGGLTVDSAQAGLEEASAPLSGAGTHDFVQGLVEAVAAQ
jgi:predicted Zn-dependent protease